MQTLSRRRRSALFLHSFFSLTLVLGAALALDACAGGTAAPPSAGGSPVRRNSNRIEAAELATVAEVDVYTAISRLRPSWLRSGSRGTLPAVLVDGSPQSGGAEVLQNFRAADVSMLEFMSASDATTRFGTGYTAGAIIVTTRR